MSRAAPTAVTTPNAGCIPRRVKSSGCKFSASKASDVLASQLGKSVQELLQRLALALTRLRKAVKGIERPRFAVFQYHSHPRHPVVAFSRDEMAHDVERAPGVFSFVGVHPDAGLPAQPRIQGCRSTGKKCDGVGQSEFRRICHDYVDAWLARRTRAQVALQSAPGACRSWTVLVALAQRKPAGETLSKLKGESKEIEGFALVFGC